MPGILPMKVIKVGTSSQSRIAQACDRCRSKKIRCDGIRPTCTQCSNVQFECRTSDKLSRRAFPRGYTESLEERVRVLEAEVRDLKDLLDEKDEKIDMLSRMHGNRRSSMSSGASPRTADTTRDSVAPPTKEDTFRVQASPLLLGVENSDSFFMGASSGRAFIEAFKRKIQENGKSCSDFSTEAFLHIQGCYPLVSEAPSQASRAPPRLFSDRCVNVYFQEWSPLFPVLHKPSFLRVYEEFVADPDKVKSKHKLAQLYLVFSIAALSAEQPDLEQVAACEVQWQRCLEGVLMDDTMMTLQCLVLALMYCTIRADYKRLQHYKAIAVGLSHRLGLHQSQKRFSFGALTIETRKKVFWTLYTLDCFSGAILGLPKLMKEDDIHTEYPSDTDDEYVTEKGFQPTLPGEHTRLSSALALFRVSRILARVLEKNYPAATSHELSLQQMSALEAELDAWSEALPQHLKLTFRQDKPSTDVTGSRSPLLALAYYYTRTLILRPAVGSSLGHKAAPALIAIGECSKHTIQIVQLLEERSMSFSFCLNKADLLILCGMTLLYQTIDLKPESKVKKDNERLINAVIKTTSKSQSPGSYDLKRVAGLLISVDDEALPKAQLPTPPRQSPDISVSTTASIRPARPSPPVMAHTKTHRNPLGRHPSASASETDLLLNQEKIRRMTMPASAERRPELHRAPSRSSFDSSRREAPSARRDHRLSMSQVQRQLLARTTTMQQNLDYLPLGDSPGQSQPPSPVQSRLAQLQQHRASALTPPTPAPYPSTSGSGSGASQLHHKVSGVSSAEWEALLGSMDSGQINLYDAIYGGPALSLAETPLSAPPIAGEWSPDAWDLSGFNLGDLGGGHHDAAQSVPSVSDESLSSGEEMPGDLGLVVDQLDYRNTLLPGVDSDGFILDGLDASYRL